MEALAWQTVAQVLQQVQGNLDHPWDLDQMATVSGYERHHLAHLFSEIVGEPPTRYLRRLRLERAAYDLMSELPVGDSAYRAGYASGEAFSRAFKRQFGIAPASFRKHALANLNEATAPVVRRICASDAFPEGLSSTPRIEAVGPWQGWTVVVDSFELGDVAQGMGHLMQRCPPDGPWQLGGLAQPWGWLASETSREARELRCLRLTDAIERTLPPPLVRWSWPRDWFAVFDYQGPLDGISGVCQWMAAAWPERVGLRLGYGPLISRLEGLSDPTQPVSAKLYLVVRPLSMA
ncbi:MAG: AraC family transcriptional regulator [Myxococcota bacterium]